MIAAGFQRAARIVLWQLIDKDLVGMGLGQAGRTAQFRQGAQRRKAYGPGDPG